MKKRKAIDTFKKNFEIEPIYNIEDYPEDYAQHPFYLKCLEKFEKYSFDSNYFIFICFYWSL